MPQKYMYILICISKGQDYKLVLSLLSIQKYMPLVAELYDLEIKKQIKGKFKFSGPLVFM